MEEDGSGGPAGTRTQDPRLKRALLYRLSYRPADANRTRPAAAFLGTAAVYISLRGGRPRHGW